MDGTEYRISQVQQLAQRQLKAEHDASVGRFAEGERAPEGGGFGHEAVVAVPVLAEDHLGVRLAHNFQHLGTGKQRAVAVKQRAVSSESGSVVRSARYTLSAA